jgi:hypothetical protein
MHLLPLTHFPANRGTPGITSLRPITPLWRPPRGLMWLWVAAIAAISFTGCTGVHQVSADLRDCSYPILVGPVHRIGGAPGEALENDPTRPLYAYKSWREQLRAETDGGILSPPRHVHAVLGIDNLAKVLNDACAGVPGPKVYIDTMRAQAYAHVSLVMDFETRIRVDVRVTEPDQAGDN